MGRIISFNSCLTSKFFPSSPFISFCMFLNLTLHTAQKYTISRKEDARKKIVRVEDASRRMFIIVKR